MFKNSKFKNSVIDEADEMLQGFKEQMYKIFYVMPDNIQIGLFSATMRITRTYKGYYRIKILVKNEELTLQDRPILY